MKVEPWKIITGNKNFDDFFLAGQLQKGKIAELNYSDEQTKSYMMITFLTDIMTYGFTPNSNIKQLLSMKSEIIYFDNNRKLNIFVL